LNAVKSSWERAVAPSLLPTPPAATARTYGLNPPADADDASTDDGYVGLVEIDQRQALVLGDEPAMTTYLPSELLFLRWAPAYEEDDLVSAERRAVRDGVEWDADEDVRWMVAGPVVMFDSAWPEAALEPDNHLVVDLRPRPYRVRATYRAEGDTWMILVQLQPLQ
jgi:hypothetical protein